MCEIKYKALIVYDMNDRTFVVVTNREHTTPITNIVETCLAMDDVYDSHDGHMTTQRYQVNNSIITTKRTMWIREEVFPQEHSIVYIILNLINVSGTGCELITIHEDPSWHTTYKRIVKEHFGG